MTPDNDKTTRSIFCKVKIGFDEWNDRRDYRQKYEKSTINLQNKTKISHGNFIVFETSNVRSNLTIIHERERFPNSECDEDYMHHLSILFPESKVARRFIQMTSFGMAANPDGTFSNCDRCGKQLHALNTSNEYGLCDNCEIEIRQENHGDFNIND